MPTVTADRSHRTGECSRRSTTRIQTPRVQLEEVRRVGDGAKDLVTARGFVEGECLTTAGLYIDGTLAERIEVHTQPTSKRFAFEVSVGSELLAEVRVYTVKGDVAVVQVR